MEEQGKFGRFSAVEYLDWYFECDDGGADKTAVEAWNTVKTVLDELRSMIKEFQSSKKSLGDGRHMEEKQAIEPICKIIFNVPYYFCGDCKTMLNMYGYKALFCSQCGKAVKWSELTTNKGN